jgi:molecular chaperone HtpG
MDIIIDETSKIDDLKLIKHLVKKGSPFLPKIKTIYEIVKEQLNSRISVVFKDYTLHNVDHSLRIIGYMGDLVDDLDQLDELEIVLLILSALMHDIGMAVSDKDIVAIKDDAFAFSSIKFSVMKRMKDGDEKIALQEYVRKIHSSLSSRYILGLERNYFMISELAAMDFQKELATICESHTMNYDWIKSNLRNKEVKGDHVFNPQYIACILRLADILDIDSNRTPPRLYELISPNPESKVEWEQHFVITNYKKIVQNEKTNQKKIVFHGKADNAHIHRKLLTYIGWVREELANATMLVNSMPSQYNLIFDTNPDIHIQAEGYTFSNYQMTLQFKAISSLLMGEKIYGNNSLGLRELIQNSMDACRIRQEIELEEHEFGEDEYIPKIKVILDKERSLVSIRDNGIGMSLDVIKKHFLNIGVSYYNSSDFQLMDFTYKPIGNFGIGFLSCFMLSNEVSVITRYYRDKNRYLIELEKGNEYTSLTEKEDFTFEGTEVRLDYNQFLSVFGNKPENVRVFLKQYFLFDEMEVELIDKANETKDIIRKGLEMKIEDPATTICIDLSNYIEDIEGYVHIKPKQPFIKSFKEIDFETESIYYYDIETGLTPITDWSAYSIDDYLKHEKIKFLSIPLVEKKNEADYLNGLKFTKDDVSEVIEKLNKDLNWISVIFKPEDHYFSYDDDLAGGGSDDELFEALVKLGHSKKCSTRYFVKSVYLFEGKKNSLYLPFEEKDKDVNYSYYRTKKHKELYIRSVLIKDFVFILPLLASVFEVESIMVNILSKAFIPDISRNNVDPETKFLINRLIGTAILKGALDMLSLETEEKETLLKYIKHYYEPKIVLESKPNSPF